MAKSRHDKEIEEQVLVDKLRRMKVAVLTSVDGLRVQDSNELRSLLRKAGVEYVVAKKTMLKRALQEASLDHISLDGITRGVALSFGYSDEVTPAQLVAQFAKTHEVITWYGGIMGSVMVDGDRMKLLASLPSRDELRAQVVYTIAAPLYGFVHVLSGTLHSVVNVLKSYHTAKESTPATSKNKH